VLVSGRIGGSRRAQVCLDTTRVTRNREVWRLSGAGAGAMVTELLSGWTGRSGRIDPSLLVQGGEMWCLGEDVGLELTQGGAEVYAELGDQGGAGAA
jgi:hypothetical protein